METDGKGGAPGVGEKILEESGANSAGAMRGQQREIDDAKFRRAAVDDDPTDALPLAQNDLELRVGKHRAIGRLLRLELHLEEGSALGGIPAGRLEFFLPRGGVEQEEEFGIARQDGTERDLRAGRQGRFTHGCASVWLSD